MSGDSSSLNRRRVLQTLAGTAAAGSLAGCAGWLGDDDDDDDLEEIEPGDEDELGERVPPIVLMFVPGFGPWDDAAELMIRDLENALEHDFEAEPAEIARFLDSQQNDDRSYHLATWSWDSQPTSFDPGRVLRNFGIDNAGEGQGPNWGNYANCEFSQLVERQLITADEEERLEILHEAQRIYSEDRVEFSVTSNDGFGAGRQDMVDFDGLGTAGITVYNPTLFFESTPTDGDRYVYGTTRTPTDQVNHLAMDSTASNYVWNTLVHSPMFHFDKDRERQLGLAEDFDVSDDGTEITFELREGAQFHNGDPITAEDVAFTFEFINEKEVPNATSFPIEETEAVDETTAVIRMSDPAPLFTSQHAGNWGILHKETWEDVDVVGEFDPDDIVGSGPFELTSITRDQSMVLEPHPHGHPVHNPDHEVVIQQYADTETMTRALEQGEIQVVENITGADLARLSDQMDDDVLLENVSEGIGAWKVIGAYSRPPMYMNEFMDAIGMSINRQEINAVSFDGQSEEILHSGNYLTNHPFSPPAEDLHFYTDDPTGDPQGARDRLQEAGWGWDEDGNLRYPEDVDPEPLWPEGERPSPDDFPCLSEDGEIILD